MFRYSINLIWSNEDNSYIATIPEFPGLSAFGKNPEEVAKEASIAAKGFIDVYKADGCKLPALERGQPQELRRAQPSRDCPIQKMWGNLCSGGH